MSHPSNGNGNNKIQDELVFQQHITLTDTNGDPFIFQSVASKVCLRQGSVSKCFTVRPVVHQVDAPTLALKQADLDAGSKDQNVFKKQLQILETELKSLKEIRHQSVLDLLDFKVQKATESADEEMSSDTTWTVSILTEFAEKGSLEELLDITGSLGISKVRSWTIELLDALRFLHEKGIAHEDIHTGNILLVREQNGDVKPKLADAGFQRKLHALSDKTTAKDTLTVAKSAYWVPPEIANTSHPQYTQKTDMWDFGIMFLQVCHSYPFLILLSMTLTYHPVSPQENGVVITPRDHSSPPSLIPEKRLLLVRRDQF